MILKTEIEKYAPSISIMSCGKSPSMRMRSRRIPVLKLTSMAAVLISVYIGTFFGPKLLGLVEYIRGYAYNYQKNCIRYTRGSKDKCWTLMDCEPCIGVTAPVVLQAEDVTKEIFEKLDYSGKPFVIKNVIHNGDEFTLDWIRDIYLNDDEVMQQLKDPKCEYFLQLNSSLEVFLRTPKNSSYFDNPWYVGWKVCQPTIIDKFAQLVGRPKFFHENASVFTLPHVFMGTPGPGVSKFHVDLHITSQMAPSWQIQLTGRKIWRVHPPPECWNTCFKDPIEILLEPGDALFVQSGYWYHATEVLGTDLSELSQVLIFDYESGLIADLI